MGTLKNPTKCLWRWEPDRRSNFFFSPPAHLCAVACMTEISLIVTLNNQFNQPIQTGRIMVWWCPSGSPSVRPTLRPSVRPTLRPSVRPTLRPSVRVSVRPFSALFSYMLWHIELKFCIWLCFDVLQIKFDCVHLASIFEGVMPLCELRI